MINTEDIRTNINLTTIGATHTTEFKVLDSTHLVVKVIRQSDQQTVTLTDGVDYTVTDVGEDAGAQVSVSLYETANNITDWTTYDSGPWDLFMTLDIPLTQLIDFIKVGRYNSQLNENMGDKLTQICQLTREGVTPGSLSLIHI